MWLNHLYLYGEANPINRIDPFGLAPGDWWDPSTYFPEPNTEPRYPGSGCGDEETEGIVPDIYPEACKAHDKCYATPGQSQLECDLQLAVDVFHESGPWPNITAPFFWFLAVEAKGGNAYKRARSKRYSVKIKNVLIILRCFGVFLAGASCFGLVMFWNTNHPAMAGTPLALLLFSVVSAKKN